MEYKKCYLHMGFDEDLVCTSETCEQKLICSECSILHKSIHSEGFIYKFEQLINVHKANKFVEVKKQLVSSKMDLDESIKRKLSTLNASKKILEHIERGEKQIVATIDNKIKEYMKAIKQLVLRYQKSVQKIETRNPQKMISKIVAEIKKELEIAEECKTEMRDQIRNMVEWAEKGLDQFSSFNEEIQIIIETIQIRKTQILKRMNLNFKTEQKIAHLDISLNNTDRNQSYEQKYFLTKRIDWQNQRLMSELDKLTKKTIKNQGKLVKYQKEVRDLLAKIADLQLQLAQKTKKFAEIEKKKERELLNIQQSIKDQKKLLDQFLLKKGVDLSVSAKELELNGKGLKNQELLMIVKNLPKVIHLNLSDNRISQQELQVIFELKQLKSLKLNFMKLTEYIIKKLPNQFKMLECLHLDSNNIDDDIVTEICKFKLNELSLMDNNITDLGGQRIANSQQHLIKLYLSYNKISARSIESLSRFCYRLQVLHVARNRIKNKGAMEIAKGMKELKELFIGGCEISKQGCLPIARNNLKLRKLSLGQNQISTDAISQIIMYLIQLEWLDVSYNNLTPLEIERVYKIARTNEALVLETQQN